MNPAPVGPLDPVPASPSATRRWYDRASSIYARFLEDLEYPPTRQAIEFLDLRGDERVLDLGCGSGRAVVGVARRLGPEGRVIGVDFAPGMCREATHSIHEADVGDRAAVVCGDVTALPIAAGTADAVVASFVLDLLSVADIEATLAAVDRVLGPDGRFAVVSLADSTAPLTRLYRGLRRVFPTQMDCRPIPVTSLLEAAGFAIERTRRVYLYGLPVTVALGTPGGTV